MLRFAVALLLLFPCAVIAQPRAGEPVAVTEHFAFHSDFSMNLNDALTAAGTARRGRQAELFREAPEQICFDELSPAERAAWNRAVDFYAEISSPKRSTDRERLIPRLDLAGIAQDSDWSNDDDRRLAVVMRAFRVAASPAYDRCRWRDQDAQNRQWISAAVALLEQHGAALGRRLTVLYGKEWENLPFRVDVVDAVGSEGANSVSLEPPGVHILVASGAPTHGGRAALEALYHEASHFLAGRGSPLVRALDDATLEHGTSYRGDLVHASLYLITGEAVRLTYAAAGDRAYTPFIYALNLYTDDLRKQLDRAWSGYVGGRGSLAAGAESLVRSLR